MELLRHRPLAPRKPKVPLAWRVTAGMASGALAVFVVISVILASRLAGANHVIAGHERMACRANVDGMRKKDASYLAMEAALGKLMADTPKNVDAGFGPFLTAAFQHADLVADPDYEHILAPFVLSVIDFRAGSMTADKLESAADLLMVQSKKSEGKLHTILNAALPQGC